MSNRGNRQSALYRTINHAYHEIRFGTKEDFFVSYAVRGPTFINEYGGVQYDMHMRGPLPANSTVSQPGPLSSTSQCVERADLEDGSGVI
jgi:hypothetical protein